MIVRRGVAVLLSAAAMLVFTGTAVLAHPLGNFSVNVHSALTLHPDRVDLAAVVDAAEIPTRQARPEIDTDGDGSLGGDELAAAAGPRCRDLAEQLVATVDGSTLTWRPLDASLVAQDGAAGLQTLRLECDLTAEADLSRPRTLRYVDEAGGGRVGWHEITARGEDVELVDPPVGPGSISDELRTYPDELLRSPLDQREAVLSSRPGSGGAAAALGLDTADGGSPLTRLVTAGDRLLQDTIGREDLTPMVGGLAVLLAVLLGAGHAALPGHGKTVMAAYLAGRRGTRSDALIVGATVTLTHTAGVLLLGLALSVGTAVAGEVVLQRLGLVSGLLIAGIGVSMLRDAVRGGPRDHGHHHGPGHDHGLGAHDHGHTHDHGPGAHGVEDIHAAAHHGPTVRVATRVPDATAGAEDVSARFSRRGLVGMAMAGGLVPSPSALVVLLGSVALGRTLLGVSLVLAYGVGMAGTLTAVGLLLVRLRDRFDHVREGRIGRIARRIGSVLPAATAALVLIVGLGLVVRSLLA